MRIIASNDSLEMIDWESAERPNYMSHNKEMLDQRADWTMRLLSAWGASATLGDVFAKYGMPEPAPHKQPIQAVPPQELVMRICEVVDAAWSEMHHRGWIVNTGSLDR